jgi:hypothetical protein
VAAGQVQDLAITRLRSAELDQLVRKHVEVAQAARALRSEAVRRIFAETIAQRAMYLASGHGLTDAQITDAVKSMQGAWDFARTVDTALAASESNL